MHCFDLNADPDADVQDREMVLFDGTRLIKQERYDELVSEGIRFYHYLVRFRLPIPLETHSKLNLCSCSLIEKEPDPVASSCRQGSLWRISPVVEFTQCTLHLESSQ